ncbi:MAG: hypothetical protein M1830_003316 [Pleopsidium flavum]|nr:MAG: hypothetical protein M1830_003316 [Pleopsidium flavum]
MSSTVLSDLDINTTVPQPTTSTSTSTSTSTTTTTNNKPKSMDYHRQVLQSRLDEDKFVSPPLPSPTLPSTPSKQTYISPSDTILSPCTQKLSAFKEKRFMKYLPVPSLTYPSPSPPFPTFFHPLSFLPYLAKPQSLFAKTSSKSMLNGTKDTKNGDAKESSPFASSNNKNNNNDGKKEEVDGREERVEIDSA